MQLGIGSYTYGWNVNNKMNELDLIDKAKQFSVELLQIGDNLPLHEFEEERLQVFEKALKQNNISLEIGARGLTEDQLNNYILLCKRFNAKMLRFIIDDKEYKPGVNDVISILKSYVVELKEKNIILGLENHDRLKAKDYARIIDKVNSSQVGICLDTVNSVGAGESLETIVETLAPYTVNLHIKDFGIARLPHKQGFIIDGRIAGEGMLNISSLLQILKAFKRCKTGILEQWVPPEKDMEATVKKEQQWAERSMMYLKHVIWEET